MQNRNVIKAQVDVIAAFLAEQGIETTQPALLTLLGKLDTAGKAALAAESNSWSVAGGAMSDAQYVGRRGNCCPSCGGTDTYGGQLTVDNGKAYQGLVCPACYAEWSDTYVLTGYAELDGGVDLDSIQQVIDDVKSRTGTDKFAIESDARGHINESCNELGEHFNDAEMKIAVERLTS
jgi:hypothetical protein